MDSQNRDETKLRRREEMLARRVGQALDQLQPESAGECPDAAIIAAYAEQALDRAESAQWEDHFAACARCRKILRVLAASADSPLAEQEVARLGELVSAARAPVDLADTRAGRARPRLVDWRARWLAPALGVAAVLLVWLVMRPPWRAPDRGASETLVAQAPQQELAPSPAPAGAEGPSKTAPSENQKLEAARPADRPSARTAPLNSPIEPPPKAVTGSNAALDNLSRVAGAPTSSLQDEKKAKGLAGGRQNPPPSSSAASPALSEAQGALPAAPAPPSEASASSTPSAGGGLRVETNSNAVENTRSRDKQAGAVSADAGAVSGGSAQAKASLAEPAEDRKEQAFSLVRPLRKDTSVLKAPSGSILWRAGTGGSIERSTDAGKTWAPQSSPSQEDWLAGAAVSEKVCWVAGRRGAIARTVDGERWERISPPAQAAGSGGSMPDWTGISARDAQSATITAMDGRKFTTADGGKTWQPQ